LFAITVDAFNIAETYRTPVILLLDEVVGHTREKLVMPQGDEIPLVERLRTAVAQGVDYHPYLPREDGRLPMSDFGGVHRYNVTGLFHDMWGFPSNKPEIVHELMRHLVDKINNNANKIARYKEWGLDDAEHIFISYGSAARSALQVVQDRRPRGEKLGLLEIQSLWPFPDFIVREKCARAKTIVVVELNMGQVLQVVRSVVDHPERVFLANRADGTLILPKDIRDFLRVIQGKGI
jgi:2-oxoglutarate ferredoxin oxidoreductase subunit alpha